MPATESRRSPNVLSLDDVVRVCHPWASCSFLARVTGFPSDYVKIEAVPPSDDPGVQNEWIVRFDSVGVVGLMDHRYAG